MLQALVMFTFLLPHASGLAGQPCCLPVPGGHFTAVAIGRVALTSMQRYALGACKDAHPFLSFLIYAER